MQADAASGLSYDRARYDGPSAGRFPSQDPLQSVAPYTYVADDPVDLVDPTGAQELVEEAEVISIDEELTSAEAEVGATIDNCLEGAASALGAGL